MNESSNMYGTCQICKGRCMLSRKVYYYDIDCECHSPQHFEIVEHCKACIPVEPETITVTLVSTEVSSVRKSLSDGDYVFYDDADVFGVVENNQVFWSDRVVTDIYYSEGLLKDGDIRYATKDEIEIYRV